MNDSRSAARQLEAASIATATRLLAAQDGALAPFSHVLDASGRMTFFGRYDAELAPRFDRAIAALRNHARSLRPVGAAITYAASDRESGCDGVCIEIETLDSAPEVLFVPYIFARPPIGPARVTTSAARRTPGTTVIFAP